MKHGTVIAALAILPTTGSAEVLALSTRIWTDITK
jgi:hypothetical protein